MLVRYKFLLNGAIVLFFSILLPGISFAQATITGRVLSQSDNKPVSSASVFLNNTSVGDKTGNTGTFTLIAKPGEYELVISIIGFETWRKRISISYNKIALGDILLYPKRIILNEVIIKSNHLKDYERQKYLTWFTNEFLGMSRVAEECKISNPEAIDLNYDEKKNVLTASSSDFLEIENDALGYKIKYLLTNFKLDNDPGAKFHLDYEGSIFFEEMKGTPSQQKRWQQRRQNVYEGSVMHFLRSVVADRTEEEGFRVLGIKKYNNPERPDDSLIKTKIKFYQQLKLKTGNQRDSLTFWIKKNNLPKTLVKLLPTPLYKADIIKPTNQKGLFALEPGMNNASLYITYNKNHHYYINAQSAYINGPNNKESTLVDFNSPDALFYEQGWLIPNGLIFNGLWATSRIAELLPIDYKVPQNILTKEDSSISNRSISKLTTFLSTRPTEKAYLQFDKPYYAAGDTMYFKAYITLGEKHRLSDLSGVLHVDLVNTKNKTDQSVKLQITDGVAWGDFALPDSLPSGNYKVLAYTQWMRNDGNYFERNIPIGSLQAKIPESNTARIKPVIEKADLQFFPEGGQLVTGISSRIAFKSVGVNGLGMDVKGIVIDDSGNEVSRFSSAHLGMGSFYITPQAGKIYRAKVSFADGTTNTVDLPLVSAKGIALSINNDSTAKATVKIEANAVYFNENKGKAYTLLIYSGGVATTVNVTLDSAVVKLDVIKRRLHTGVTTVTLFPATNEPLAERLIFVQNYDQLNLEVSSDKAVYAKRGKANILLKAIDRKGEPASGHFSVSVVDESKVSMDENSENTILTDLLLTSDLKGYIEQPNYYFNKIDNKTTADLDLVMLTHGYRRFEWKKLLNNEYPPIAFQPEKGLEISGKATNLFGKPIAKGMVTLVPVKGGPLLSSTSDDKGGFHFSNLVFYDTTHFVLSAVNAKGRNSTKLTWFNNVLRPLVSAIPNKTIDDTTMSTYIGHAKEERNEAINQGRGNGIMLKEVKIRDKKLDDKYETQSLAGAGHADQVMHAEEIEQIGGSLLTSLNGRLRGVSFLPPGPSSVPYLTMNLNTLTGSPPPMLVIVDGAQLRDPADWNFLNTNDVETVEVLKSANASIYGMNAGGGVLVFTTKRGGGRALKDITSIGVLPIAPAGFYKARGFYAPKYDNPNMSNRRDLRSTIYWKPELQTDKDGNATFDFYNADGTGAYRVVIEGIDDKGNLGRRVYRYKVE